MLEFRNDYYTDIHSEGGNGLAMAVLCLMSVAMSGCDAQ